MVCKLNSREHLIKFQKYPWWRRWRVVGRWWGWLWMVIGIFWSFYNLKYFLPMGLLGWIPMRGMVMFLEGFSFLGMQYSREYCVKPLTKHGNIFTFLGQKKFFPLLNALIKYYKSMDHDPRVKMTHNEWNINRPIGNEWNKLSKS